MFFETNRLPIVQQMILAKTDEERRAPLAKLLPFQRADFAGLFRAMDGLPVTIRLIDPPLHEFLPGHDELLHDTTELEGRLQSRKTEWPRWNGCWPGARRCWLQWRPCGSRRATQTVSTACRRARNRNKTCTSCRPAGCRSSRTSRP